MQLIQKHQEWDSNSTAPEYNKAPQAQVFIIQKTGGVSFF